MPSLRMIVEVFSKRDVLSLTLMISIVDYMKYSITTHEAKDINVAKFHNIMPN